jgi:hypothetical protein
VNDDFYIGYRDESPSALARHTRRLVAAITTIAVGVTALVAALQTPAEPGAFEYGVKRTFEGVLHESPLPMLHSVSPDGSVTNYLLVGSGKHGLPAFARGHDGQRVRFLGSLIQKGAGVLVELNDPDSFLVLASSTAAENRPADEAIGRVVLTGELVDTKCYFGVMRPATGKVHRGCAVRCLSGGVPPGLLLRDGAGGAMVVLLTGPESQRLRFEVEWAARLVRAEGRLTWRGTFPCLEVARLSLAEPEHE